MRYFRPARLTAFAYFGFAALAGCASTQLGYDSWTRTFASPEPARRAQPGYKISCERRAEDCLLRAESLCGGNYALVGNPHVSPRVQALIGMRLVTLNTDNPQLVHIVCTRPDQS